ncbi:MAG: hypothetical protein U1F57_00575 [bacterium]
MIWLFFLFLFFVFLAIIIAVVFLILQRAKELPLLAREGMTTSAKVIWKTPAHTDATRTSLIYEFQDSMGKTYQRNIELPRSLFDALNVGDPLEVVYLPREPKKSSAKYWVDRVRSSS